METAAGATQRRLYYAVSGSGAVVPSGASAGATLLQDTSYVDVMKDLSLCNHRLYRSGRVPMVRVGFTNPFNALVTNAAVLAQVLPNTWPVRKAHQLALKEYLSATKEERRATGQARWHDFKVFFDDGMRTGNHTLSPVGIDTSDSEWNYSEIYNHTISANTQFMMIGNTSNDAYGIIDQYDKAANTDTDVPTNPGSTAPYEGLTADREQENMDNLLDEGDNPPYNPNSLQVQLPYMGITQGFGKSDQLVSNWMPAPCGLIKLTAQINTSANLPDDTFGGFFVEVMAGDYKGIHATPMGLKLS